MTKTCPLGHTCDECLWQLDRIQDNHQTGETRVTKICAVVEMVMMAQETARQTYSVGAAVESFREETIKGNDVMARMLLEGIESANGNGAEKRLDYDPSGILP